MYFDLKPMLSLIAMMCGAFAKDFVAALAPLVASIKV